VDEQEGWGKGSGRKGEKNLKFSHLRREKLGKCLIRPFKQSEQKAFQM